MSGTDLMFYVWHRIDLSNNNDYIELQSYSRFSLVVMAMARSVA